MHEVFIIRALSRDKRIMNVNVNVNCRLCCSCRYVSEASHASIFLDRDLHERQGSSLI